MTTTLHPAARTVPSVHGDVEVPLPGTYDLDASHTHVGFVARHLMVSKTRGSFPAVSGTIVIGDDHLASRVDVTIETASVETGDERRDAHLRSGDFFAADEHPVMTYRSTAVHEAGPGRWAVEGDLTVRDVTRPVLLDVTFEGAVQDPWGATRIGFTATGEIDREQFGLTWNQALEGGGFLVGKLVTLDIEAEAVRQERAAPGASPSTGAATGSMEP
jgi:polyisoprenoid-binding protein YceI